MKTISWKFGFWHNNDEKAYKKGFLGLLAALSPNPSSEKRICELQLKLSDDGFGLSTADNLEKPFYTVFYGYFVKKPDFQEIVITVSTVLKQDF